ncbi:MAG: phosphatidylglycerophosphatase A [Chlorobi bacterium OLB7]|nr:MAG: phosphatidylglycerophosphatase A [Chlorobi bacterium OLB7]
MASSSALLRKHNIPFWKQLVASGLFTGLSPVASGTVASAVAVGFYFVPGLANPWAMLAMAGVAFGVGLWLAGPCEEALGDDPSFVTIDEFAGQWITLASPLVSWPAPLAMGGDLLLHLPRFRHRQDLARQLLRPPPRPPGHHGRRRGCRNLRQPCQPHHLVRPFVRRPCDEIFGRTVAPRSFPLSPHSSSNDKLRGVTAQQFLSHNSLWAFLP